LDAVEAVIGGDFNAVPCEHWRSSCATLDCADCTLRAAIAPERWCSHAQWPSRLRTTARRRCIGYDGGYSRGRQRL
jgi:hypothetical protein